jgi:hypothetical protein
MQTSVPELMDIAKEPEAVHKMYGTQPGKVSFANNCLLARRLVERGVRFVQLYHHGWDYHGEVDTGSITNPEGLPKRCKEVDSRRRPQLIRDLKQRGLLDDTIVLWGGEFGRTPINQNPGSSPVRSPSLRIHYPLGGGRRGQAQYYDRRDR